MADFGEAWVDLHVKSDKIPKETDDALHKMGKDAEHTLDDVGHDFGDHVAKGMGDELEKRGPELSERVRRGLTRKRVKMTETVRFDKDNNVVQRWVKTVTTDIEDAFRDAGRPGGPFGRIGSGIADAIGAGFNISGKSPLIIALIPVIGVIIGLVAAALQAINALVAVIATLPALLGAIALQAGVLMAAFNGVGTAISGACPTSPACRIGIMDLRGRLNRIE